MRVPVGRTLRWRRDRRGRLWIKPLVKRGDEDTVTIHRTTFGGWDFDAMPVRREWRFNVITILDGNPETRIPVGREGGQKA